MFRAAVRRRSWKSLSGIRATWQAVAQVLRLGGERRGEEAERPTEDERSPVHYSIT
jgi:hypothetical protein